MAAPTFQLQNLQVTSYAGAPPTTQQFTFQICQPGATTPNYTTPVTVTGSAVASTIVVSSVIISNILNNNGTQNVLGSYDHIYEVTAMGLAVLGARDPTTITGTIYIDELASSIPFTATIFGETLGFVTWRERPDHTLPTSSRSLTDGVGNGTTTFTSATANFTATDVGQGIYEVGNVHIPANTTIASVVSTTQVTLSNSVASASGINFFISAPSLTAKVGTMATFESRTWNVVNSFAPNEWVRPINYRLIDNAHPADTDYANFSAVGQNMRRLGFTSLGQDTSNPHIRSILKDQNLIPGLHAYDNNYAFTPPGAYFDWNYQPALQESGNMAGLAAWAKRNATQNLYSGFSASEVTDYPLSDEPAYYHFLEVGRMNTGAFSGQSMYVNATAGTFTLTFNGQTTGALAYNITAAALQTALQGLSSVGAGNALVSFGPGNATGINSSPPSIRYDVYFLAAPAQQQALATPLLITANTASLTGTVTIGAPASALANNYAALADFQNYLQAQTPALTPSMFGQSSWSNVTLVDASNYNGTLAQRINYFWTMFWMQHAGAVHHANATNAIANQFHAGIGTRANFAEWSQRFWDDQGTVNNDVRQSEGAFDYAEWGRVKGGNVVWQEDWFGHPASWQWMVIASRLRSAAAYNGLDIGGYVIPNSMYAGGVTTPGVYLRRMMALFGNGGKTIFTYTYGPFYANSDGWNEGYIRNQSVPQDTIDCMQMIARSEDLMAAGTPYANKVAIYYPRISEPWDIGTQVSDLANTSGMLSPTTNYMGEVEMLALALAHAGIQVDWVDDVDVQSSPTMAKYKVMYVTSPNIPAESQTAISNWVNGGGVIVTTPGAGTLDRYNSPLTTVSTLGGFSEAPWSRINCNLLAFDASWAITDINSAALVAPGRAVDPAGYWRPALTAPGATIKATFNDNSSPAISYKAVGSGARWHFSWFPGCAYFGTTGWDANGAATSMPSSNMFNTTLQNWIIAPITSAPANVLPPMAHNTTLVDLMTLTSTNGWAVTAINWDTSSKTNVTIRMRTPFVPTKVTSYRYGTLSVTTTADGYTVVLPQLQYADILRIYSGTAPTVPSTPANPAAMANSTRHVTLSWTAVSGATSYTVQRSATSNGTYTPIGWVRSSATSGTITCLDKSCSPGTNYYYEVFASNSEGNSAATSPVSVSTPASVANTWTQVQNPLNAAQNPDNKSITTTWTTQPVSGHLLIAVSHFREPSAGYNFTDGATTLGSTTLTSTSQAQFIPADVGRQISESTNTYIPRGSYITGYISPTQVTMSTPANATGGGITFKMVGGTSADVITPAGWSVAGQCIASGYLLTTMFYKVAGASEPMNLTISTVRTGGLETYMFEYSGNNTNINQVMLSSNTAYPFPAALKASTPWLEASLDNVLHIGAIGVDDGLGTVTFQNTWTDGWSRATQANAGFNGHQAGYCTVGHLMAGNSPAIASSQESFDGNHAITGVSAVFMAAGAAAPPMVEYDDFIPI